MKCSLRKAGSVCKKFKTELGHAKKCGKKEVCEWRKNAILRKITSA
jgi:hypothetical protein